MSSIDFTSFHALNKETNEKKILTCILNLSRQDVLNALSAKSIVIHGTHYEVPEHDLIDLLWNRRFGEIELNLEEIK